MQQLLRFLALAGALVGGATLMALRPASPVPTASDLEPGKFDVDPAHSSVVFRVTHQGVSPAYGRFNRISGAFVFGEDVTTSSVRIEIDPASVDTNNEDRDNHLRSPDFFNVKQYPKIVFESTKIESTGEDEFDVTGELRLHGVTKEVTIPMELVGQGDRGQAGYLAGFSGEFSIQRSDFGITTYPGALGEEVHLMLGIEGRRQ